MGLDGQCQPPPLCAEGLVGRTVTDVEKRKPVTPTGFEIRTVQPIASRCPDYTVCGTTEI